MDVSIVLTHRCNLDCGYCYAGEHHRTDIDEETLRRSVELLFSDEASVVQLSFFGGEPLLAFDSLKWACELAQKRSAEEGRKLLLQCTTNGSLIDDKHVRFAADNDVLMVVSIDGTEEAHDINRPRKGGGSSFEQVRGGLQALCDAGVQTDAMMVISPKTAVHTYLSVNYLWSQGIRKVRANAALDQSWSEDDRRQLRDQLESVGFELLARRLNGEPVAFEPFEKAIAMAQAGAWVAGASSGRSTAREKPPRERLVVATGGNLYPCAPMVGDDKDESPGAALRIGHLDDGAEKIAARVAQDGVGCDKGGGCDCAAYLETGDRYVAGPMGRYYASVCAEVGKMVGETLALQPQAAVQKKGKRKRRAFLVGLGALVGGAALAAPLFATIGVDVQGDMPIDPNVTPPCEYDPELNVAGGIGEAFPEQPVAVPGQMPAEPVHNPDEYEVDGEMEAPIDEPVARPEPEAVPAGGIGAPAHE